MNMSRVGVDRIVSSSIGSGSDDVSARDKMK